MIKPENTTPISASMQAFSLDENALKDRVILITGATGGLGTELSLACARSGATVVLVSKTLYKQELLYDALERIEGAPQPAIITIDQANAPESDYAQLNEILNSEFGRLDALVHTAADVGPLSPLTQITQADWTRVMSVNLTSARLINNACLPLLTQSDNASITFTLDDKNAAYWGAYGVSKMGLLALASMVHDDTDSQTLEDGTPQIAINAIDPGPMRTPLRRKAFPGEMETESPLPESKLGPFLSLIARQDKQLNGMYLKHNLSVET